MSILLKVHPIQSWWSRTFMQRRSHGQALMATMISYAATVTVVKLSILLLYRRLFVTRTFKLLTVIVASLCMAWFIAAIMTDVFQCHPIGAAFDARLLFTDKCIDLQAFWWGVTSTNMVRCSPGQIFALHSRHRLHDFRTKDIEIAVHVCDKRCRLFHT